MGKLSWMLDKFCISSCSNTCFCVNSMEFEDEFESKPLFEVSLATPVTLFSFQGRKEENIVGLN